MSEIINIGTIANDGTGDTLRGAGEKINANFALPHFGIYDYADLATQTTPIELNVGNDYTAVLTNDGLGANTNLTYKLPTVDNLFDVATNDFNFSGLSLGDKVGVRVSILVTTTVANQNIEIILFLAQTSGSDYSIQLLPNTVSKNIGIQRFTVYQEIYIKNEQTKDFPSRILIVSDNDATVKVTDFYICASKRIV